MSTARSGESPAGTAAALPSDRWLGWLLAAALVVPLVVVPSLFVFPFVASKVWFLRPMAWAAAACLASSAILRRTRLSRPGPVAWAGIAYLASAALSAAAGVDPARSVWDTGERMTGLVTLAAVAVCFATAVRVGRHPDAWRPLLRTALAVACLVAAGGVLQTLGIVDLGVHDRASSTLGSPAYLGAFGLHAAFLGLLVLARTPSRTDRALAWAAILLGLASIGCSEARAAFVGLALGGGYVSIFTLRSATPRIRRAIWACAAVVAALAVVAVTFRDAPAVRAIPLVRRLAAFSVADGTLGSRLLAWDVALDAARERPLLGWGPNCFQHAYAAHYRPEILRWGPGETFFDDAHGIVLGTLAEQGLVGVAALTALYAAAFVALRRARVEGKLTAAGCAAAGGWLLAHAGNLLFSFEDVSSLVAFALVLAFCESAGARPETPATAQPRDGPRPLHIAGAIACALAAAAWTVVADVRPALANLRARRAMDAVHDDPRAAIVAMRASLDLVSPHAATDAAMFAWLSRQAVPVLLRGRRDDEADLLGTSAFSMLGQVDGGESRDVQRTLLRASLAEETPALSADAGAQTAVRDELTRAIAGAPRRQDLRFALASIEMRSGRFQEAADAVRAVVREDPAGGEGWARLAAVFRAAGREDEARRIVREARARGVVFRTQDAPLIEGLGE